MKKLKKIIFICSMLGILFIPNKISALTASVKLSCNATTIKAGEQTTCNISVPVTSGKISSFSGKVTLSSNLELVSTSHDSSWEGLDSNGQYDLYTDTMKDGTVPIGSFVVKVKSGVSNKSESISITGITLGDEDFNDKTPGSVSVTITVPRILSSDTDLQSLTISNGTLTKKSDTEYSATVDASSTTINATAPSRGSVSGTGTKTLNYGANTFKVISTAEDGTTKTYTLTITRPDNRSSNANLKSLDPVTGFTSDKTEYNITIPSTQDTYSVTGTVSYSSAKITYSPSNSIKLDYGEKKTISVIVTAENGNKKTYKVNVTRTDDRNDNNDLKTLTVKGIDIDFKTDKLVYNVTVENDVEEIEISAEASDKTAKIEGVGTKKLEIGSNVFKINVTAENESVKTYTITIIRKDENGSVGNLSSNTNLKNIKINGEEIELKENVFSYELTVENSIDTIDITYMLEDEKANAYLDGDEKLEVGKNTFKIIVTAEDGTTQTYKILVNREGIATTAIEKTNLFPIIIIVVTAIILIILIIVALVVRKNKKNKELIETTLNNQTTNENIETTNINQEVSENIYNNTAEPIPDVEPMNNISNAHDIPTESKDITLDDIIEIKTDDN